MATFSEPSLVELCFLPNIKEPSELWKGCVKAQKDWEKQLSSTLDKEVIQMKAYEKKMTVQLIWLTNTLEDTLPKGLNKKKVDEFLTEAYDKVDDLRCMESEPGLQQLVQHLKAFTDLCRRQKGSDSLPELSEDLIKQTHQIMMHGQANEQGHMINAGIYRKNAVCAGSHIFPSYECIPECIARLVREYNQRISKPHDQYELASWLHFNVISLHPFEDGNGRISQLLWCYSLMRDGLPFPTVLSSGRSQKHLILCLNRDRDMFVSNNPHLTTLTVVSVHKGWKNYFESA